MEINHQDEEFKVPVLEHVSRNQKGCTLCEEYMTQTLDYLGENKTQTMVIDILHDGCSRARSLRQEVIAFFFF
jgi:saposin